MIPRYYPAFLNIEGRKCVVVGGGKVAERKVSSLLRAGGDVTVISPDLTAALEKKKERGAITHVRRQYRSGDLRQAFLVIAATSRRDVNERVSSEAPCLVNTVDLPGKANFIVPSSIEKSGLRIAVSTSGASPALAGTIRKELEGLYGGDFGQFVRFLGALRARVRREMPDQAERQRFFRDVASEEMIEALRRQGFPPVRQTILKMLEQRKAEQ